MVKRTLTGTITQTSYIPDRFAHVNNVVKLKDGDTWIDGWKITHVGDRLLENAPDVNKRIRGHRHNTGDDMPKLAEQYY